MIWYYLLLVALIDLNISLANKEDICAAEDIADANIEKQTYTNSEPVGSSTHVKILKKYNVKSNNECLKNCCFTKHCHSIGIVENLCILYKCHPKEACKPKRMSGFGARLLYIVLSTSSNTTIDKHQLKKKEDLDDNTQLCEIGVPDNCPANAMCKRTLEVKRSGVCECFSGFVRTKTGCIEEIKVNQRKQPIISNPMADMTTSVSSTSTALPKRKPTTNKPSMSTIKSASRPHAKVISAHAGPDQHIHIHNPYSSTYPEIVSLHGSATNKHGVLVTNDVAFQWTRDLTSLSVGKIVNNSHQTPTLMLMDLIQGKYVFLLTVTDKNGAQASDSVNLFVTEKLDDRFVNLVDVLLETNVYTFSEQETINFSRRMGHIIEKNLGSNDCHIHVTSVSGDKLNRTMISFYAEEVEPSTKEFRTLSAGTIESGLKMKLTQHKFIFDYAIKKLQSRVCFNTCGGNGICSSDSHRCMCTLPWMNNPWHEKSTGFSNCDMHVMIIVLVCVASLFISVLMFVALRSVFRIFNRKRKFGKNVLRYKLLDNADS